MLSCRFRVPLRREYSTLPMHGHLWLRESEPWSRSIFRSRSRAPKRGASSSPSCRGGPNILPCMLPCRRKGIELRGGRRSGLLVAPRVLTRRKVLEKSFDSGWRQSNDLGRNKSRVPSSCHPLARPRTPDQETVNKAPGHIPAELPHRNNECWFTQRLRCVV